ncbi:60S ribosomal protein L15 [Frankliniella fusca]|uniref:60S ribosomal protein L15 n=1 Tax=Frankliniella fusca TaxID=407009 RepID=A0AAE1LSM6_9NEOP|nr:60S ribosomal protein L15 [Frankliniella fusca]
MRGTHFVCALISAVHALISASVRIRRINYFKLSSCERGFAHLTYWSQHCGRSRKCLTRRRCWRLVEWASVTEVTGSGQCRPAAARNIGYNFNSDFQT